MTLRKVTWTIDSGEKCWGVRIANRSGEVRLRCANEQEADAFIDQAQQLILAHTVANPVEIAETIELD